ncbi:hypothetical protein AB0N28_03505 [Streptomyces sp. NPDC051130]|uniref:hypothetical protein n=1 Tax=Streptomyces sp. NPDC051130 TaxID=3157223 RepID=UPI00343B4D57
MGQQIIKQPDGKFAVFESVTDTFILADATPEEIVTWRAEEAAQAARERTIAELEHVTAGNPRKVYRQHALTWREALKLHEGHADDVD